MANVESLALQFKCPGHGLFRTTPEGLDRMIREYLPADVPTLLREIDAITDRPGDYSNLETVTECLFVLAEISGEAV